MMVAFPEQDSLQREVRFLENMAFAGLSAGDDTELRWMAGMLGRLAEVLDPVGEDVEMERVLTAAHLAGLNESDASERLVTQFHLAVEEVEAVRELLRSGSLTPEGWQLIRMEVCRLHRIGFGNQIRWEIDGEKLSTISNEWHELGERVMFRRLAGAFRNWVVYREGNVEVRIRRAPMDAGHRWVGELRGALELECGTRGMRVPPLISCEGGVFTKVRSGSRRGA